MTGADATSPHPAITQPEYPGLTAPVEYELLVVGEGVRGFAIALPGGGDGLEAALRAFRALAGGRRADGGPGGLTLNLVAWSGADHTRAVGLILAQRHWPPGGES